MALVAFVIAVTPAGRVVNSAAGTLVNVVPFNVYCTWRFASPCAVGLQSKLSWSGVNSAPCVPMGANDDQPLLAVALPPGAVVPVPPRMRHWLFVPFGWAPGSLLSGVELVMSDVSTDAGWPRLEL